MAARRSHPRSFEGHFRGGAGGRGAGSAMGGMIDDAAAYSFTQRNPTKS